MSNRPDEQNAFEHLLNELLLEQLDVRIHARHIDMDLMVRVLLGLISAVRSKVLRNEIVIVQPFPLQHGLAAFVAGRQVAGQQTPGDGTHSLRDAGPAELLERDHVEQRSVDEKLEFFDFRFVFRVPAEIGGEADELGTTRIGVSWTIPWSGVGRGGNGTVWVFVGGGWRNWSSVGILGLVVLGFIGSRRCIVVVIVGKLQFEGRFIVGILYRRCILMSIGMDSDGIGGTRFLSFRITPMGFDDVQRRRLGCSLRDLCV